MGSSALVAPTWEIIEKLYSAPGRRYHALAHIGWCMDLLDEFSEPLRAQDVDRIEMALWFHDIVYDTKRKDNEARSGEVAVGIGRALGIDTINLGGVDVDICGTTHADAPSVFEREPSTQWVLDIDLASLGFDPEEFAKHSEMIREEYSWVPEDVYRTNRVLILKMFLDRAEKHDLYFTRECRERYEAQARENLKRAIEKLG